MPTPTTVAGFELPSTTEPALTTVPILTTVPALTAEPTGDEVVPSGFGSMLVRLTEPDGSTCERCLLVAATREQRALGLMGVTGLGGYDGMVFRFPEPISTSFWMKNTLLPLSIAFYDQAGAVVATFAMEPCTTDPCPTYGPDTPFVDAVEVEQGRLDALGFTDTARMEILDLPCEPATQ